LVAPSWRGNLQQCRHTFVSGGISAALERAKAAAARGVRDREAGK
jgi:hypothetical protein